MRIADRVKETSTTTGTGNVTVSGAVTGFQSFNTAFGNGPCFHYCILDANGTGWEVGSGYLSGGNTLWRTTILASSNSGSVITLSTGTHTVFGDLSAAYLGSINGRSLANSTGMAMP